MRSYTNRSAPGSKGRAVELWPPNRWVFNFFIRSTPLPGSSKASLRRVMKMGLEAGFCKHLKQREI